MSEWVCVCVCVCVCVHAYGPDEWFVGWILVKLLCETVKCISFKVFFIKLFFQSLFFFFLATVWDFYLPRHFLVRGHLEWEVSRSSLRKQVISGWDMRWWVLWSSSLSLRFSFIVGFYVTVFFVFSMFSKIGFD